MNNRANEFAESILVHAGGIFDSNYDYTDIVTYLLTEAELTNIDNRSRDVLYRIFINNETLTSIAKAYNISISAIGGIRHRALSNMRLDGETIKILVNGKSSSRRINGTYPISCLELSPRLNRALSRGLYNNIILNEHKLRPVLISDLTDITERDLCRMRGISEASVNEIKSRLANLNLRLREEF